MTCCNPCATPELPLSPSSPGTPGGTLPDGDTGDFLQWNGLLWVPSDWTLPLSVTEDDLGEVLTVTAADVAEFQPLFQRTLILAFGARGVAPGGLPWLFPWEFDAPTIATIETLVPPMSGRIRDMRVLHSTPLASADNITYTLVVNGVNTSLAVGPINTSVASASNLVDVVDVGALAQLSVRADGQTALHIIRPAIFFTLEF
jgi:hypothetical protein